MLSIPLTILGILPGFWLLQAFTGTAVPGLASPVFFTATASLADTRRRAILVKVDQVRVDDEIRSVAESIYNLYEAKSALSSLVERAAAGEEIVIAKNGTPMAKLVACGSRRVPREPGGWEGRVKIAPDFDAPLPEDLQRRFEGRD